MGYIGSSASTELMGGTVTVSVEDLVIVVAIPVVSACATEVLLVYEALALIFSTLIETRRPR